MEEILKDRFTKSVSISSEHVCRYITEPFSQGSLFIVLEEESSSVELDIDVKENAQLKVFIYNKAVNPMTGDFHVTVGRDAYCQFALLDMEAVPFRFKQVVTLDQPGAEFEVSTAQLCLKNCEKKGDIEVRHCAANTKGEIKNFAVLMNKGSYDMVANGNIKKGCVDAASHQATRVLTLGKGHKARVIPLLLIDENEVKASHALTIGQPNDEQLYYLQSRGLTNQQAIGLLSVGYFLPVLKLIEDEELRTKLQTEMEIKVGLYGHGKNS